MNDAYAPARSAAERLRAAYHWARLVPAAPPSEIMTSPPAARSPAIDWLMAWACSWLESGVSADRPAQPSLPSGVAWRKPSVSNDTPRERAISTRFGTG